MLNPEFYDQSCIAECPSCHKRTVPNSAFGWFIVGRPFMVMNSDARHRKEFSTENTLGGNFVLPAVDDSFAYVRRSANYALRRHWLPSSGRNATGCAFRSQLANS
jgi:hypothetical protein